MARCLTVFEAASRLGLAVATVRKMLATGELRRVYPTRRRGAVRVLDEDVDALIAKAVIPPQEASDDRR